MDTFTTEYRGHTIVVRDETAPPFNAATGRDDHQPLSKRVIEVDRIDVTKRCRLSDTTEQNTEAAKRFIDRIYPKGKS